jgi:hypothetical protein
MLRCSTKIMLAPSAAPWGRGPALPPSCFALARVSGRLRRSWNPGCSLVPGGVIYTWPGLRNMHRCVVCPCWTQLCPSTRAPSQPLPRLQFLSNTASLGSPSCLGKRKRNEKKRGNAHGDQPVTRSRARISWGNSMPCESHHSKKSKVWRH